MEAAFLADIVESPADDTPRLVFADWLDENGQAARAEFIRVQLERARLSPGDARQVGLARREEALLGEHERAWAGEVADQCAEWQFRRGLLEMVLPRGDASPSVLARAFDAHPVRELHLQYRMPGPEAFHDLPALARVERLTLHGIPAGAAEALRSPRWSRLRDLKVKRGEETDELAGALAAAPWVGALKRLEISSTGLSPLGAEALTGGALGALEWLDLAFNELLGGRVALRLVRAPELPALRGLRLVSVGLTARDGRRLADVPQLQRLRHLEVGYNDLRSGAAPLAASPHLQNLEVLDLSSTHLGTRGLAALSESPHLARLTRLELSSCQLGPDGLKQLMGNGALRGLRWLDVGTNPIMPDGAELLGSEDNPWELKHLDLRFGQVLDEGVGYLLRPRLSSLEELVLHANSIGPAGAAALARTPHLPNLRLLGLKNNRVGAEGAAALAAAESLQVLTLELETNAFGEDSKALLRRRYGRGVSLSR